MAQSYIDVTAAIAEAEKAIAAKYKALEQVAVLREVLRNAVRMKTQMTAEQRQWIDGTFPIHERKKKGSRTVAAVADAA